MNINSCTTWALVSWARLSLAISMFLAVSSCSYAQVRITYYGDTLKGNIKSMTEYRNEGGNKIKTVYTSDVPRRLVLASFYNQDLNDKFMGRWLVSYDDSGRTIETSLYCGDDSPCQSTSHKYDHNREIERRSVYHPNVTHSFPGRCNGLLDWLDGSLTNWFAGLDSSVEIYSYDYDGSAHLTKVAQTSLAFRPARVDTTTEITNYTYDHNGNRVQIENKRILVTPEYTDTTVEITHNQYDGKGNKIEVRIIKRNAAKGSTDTTRTVYIYDANRNLIETKSYFQMDNFLRKPHTGIKIGAGSEYIYDSLNLMTSHNFYHLFRQDDGSETKQMSNTWKVRKTEEAPKDYDEQGNVIKSAALTREIEYFK